MTDSERHLPPRDSGPADPSPADLIEIGMRRLTTAIAFAGAVIALAIYARPAPPRFQAMMAGDEIVRVDTRKGTLIACDGVQRCAIILEHGQHLKDSLGHKLVPAPPAPAPAPIPPAAAPAAGR
ncbi:MAG TPA: hypothetical protein VGD66_15620 [Allosphingosinicella sp.]|jgi:hypothetical protein